jgi:DNA-binding NarL/FixJ family response regulator
MSAPTRLALIDDHLLFREALRSALSDRGFELVAEAGDARSGFTQIDQTRPDVVLLDLKLPGMDGVTALREILSRPAQPKVMVVSAYATPRHVSEAWTAGAHGFALKSISLDQLVDGIGKVMAGQRWLSPGLEPRGAGADGPLSALSPRESDVFRMLVNGLTTRQIATQLCISGKTVETHRERIFRKLGVHSAVQLVRFAAAHDALD